MLVGRWRCWVLLPSFVGAKLAASSSPALANCPKKSEAVCLVASLHSVCTALSFASLAWNIKIRYRGEMKWKLGVRRARIHRAGAERGPVASSPRREQGVNSWTAHLGLCNALGASGSHSAAPRSSHLFPLAPSLLYMSHCLFYSFLPWVIQLDLNFQVMSASVSFIHHSVLASITWIHLSFCWPPTFRLALCSLF